MPRSKKQVIDLAGAGPSKARRQPVNEVEGLLAYNAELDEDGIVLHHSDIPADLWVLATNRMLENLKKSEGGLPLSVDPTFNHGQFEVTPFTYRHHLIESKS